ncbi:uncharacterized protein [Brachyistius frenatus]|uniref:uncharacterized protein isoform X1 n=1 Tax=Brachyistius frenatus TaxID=100188 RepID=UPI0037E87648
MTRVALAKLFFLVILVFIICLPEFFTLYRVSKVNFLCRPYRPCKRGNQMKKEVNGKTGNSEVKRKDMCNLSQTPDRKMWEQACIQKNQSNMTDSASLDSRGGGDDPETSWFMCKTDMDIDELHSNISTSALKLHLEVSVELQLSDAETLNLTLYGHSNHSSLHLHPPEEEGDDEGPREAFYCCLPLQLASEPTNQSHCLLWLANQTVLTATAKEKLPWKRTQKGEWWCVFRVLWLALLCVVLLTIVTIVVGQIYWGKRLCKKSKVCPAVYDFTGQQLNDGEKQTDSITPEGTDLHSYSFQSWSGTGLSPIAEAESQDGLETLLDGNIDHCYTANLHHRVHSFPSSVTEEQAW